VEVARLGDARARRVTHFVEASALLVLEVAVDAAAVCDAECEDDQLGVFDRVDHAVVADPDPPQVWAARKDARTRRAGISSQALNGRGDAPPT
jgi:hypothetical protein